MVTLAFSAMALLYGCVSAAGYYYWGNGALTLVTSDLALHSPFARNGRLPVDKLVDACILVNVFTTYPSLVLVMQVRRCWSCNFGQGGGGGGVTCACSLLRHGTVLTWEVPDL